MGSLMYNGLASLDGYIEDSDGGFVWAEPDPEVHRFINDLEREVGTYLFGRGMYETMAVWENIQGPEDYVRDFAELWRAKDKVVYSSTLDAVSTERTRLERAFDSEAVRALKESSERDLSIGGPGIAAHAFEAGLVDECHLFVVPVIVGGGKPALPRDLRVDLELLDERRFPSGIVSLRYRVS